MAIPPTRSPSCPKLQTTIPLPPNSSPPPEMICGRMTTIAVKRFRTAKQLQSWNKELQGSNHKMYKDLDTAVKRIIPLRGQIEELENLRDALSSYIRKMEQNS